MVFSKVKRIFEKKHMLMLCIFISLSNLSFIFSLFGCILPLRGLKATPACLREASKNQALEVSWVGVRPLSEASS